MALLLTACGGTAKKAGNVGGSSAVVQESKQVTAEKEELVTVNLPASFVGEGATQEEFDKGIGENGFKSATLNSDGSATFVMTKEVHTDVMKGMKETMDNAIALIPEQYSDVTAVSANGDYTSFTVTTKSKETSYTESLLLFLLYNYGEMYNHYNATPAENIHVDFVNVDTGEVIQSSDSKNMK